MHKRGISTIVASVLIVLITVAAMAILWTGVSPIIERTARIEDPNLRLKVDLDGGYTGFDKTNNILSIRVTRGADDSEIIGLKFLVSEHGNTISHLSFDVLEPNSAKVYRFVVHDVSNVDSVKVVPIYEHEGEEVEGNYFDEEERVPEMDLSSEETDTTFSYEVTSVANDNLLAYFPFTGNANDYSGNGHDGTEKGDTAFSNNYAEFDGTNDYISFSGSWHHEDEKTISFWAYPEGTVEKDYLIGAGEDYAIYFDDTNDAKKFTYNTIYDTAFSQEKGIENQIDYNDWNHYAITTNGKDIEFFKNGHSIGSKTLNNDPPEEEDIVGSLYIGDRSTNDYTGKLDDVMFYDRVLTEDEINEIHSYGRTSK